MKLFVSNLIAVIPGTREQEVIGENNDLEFDFNKNGLTIKEGSKTIDTGAPGLKVSVQSFAQALQYAVDYQRPYFRDVGGHTRKSIEFTLRNILECQEPGTAFQLCLPLNPPITIDLNERWLRAAAEHANARAAYFGLLTRDPAVGACGVTSAPSTRLSSSPT
jgi:hypothetical protein